MGAVETREGRLLTWPNILQHQVQPFSLKDPTKPGHRKILALFLVDPNIRVISTGNVPVQRKDWWAEEVSSQDSRLSRLPPEIQAVIFSFVDEFPIGWEEAEEIRKKFMKERKDFVVCHGKSFEDHATLNLCEH